MTAPSPGFTGSRLDRADALRRDPDAVQAAMRNPAAGLLRLGEGGTPESDGSGHLAWAAMPAAPGPVVLLGLDGDAPRFAPLVPAGAEVPYRSPALMAALAALAPEDAAIFATARALMQWHARHGFCANCGSPTVPIRAGWARTCPHCAAEHFPRVDPVVIMLAQHGGRVLLGRQASWPAGRYSALAGFVEPGESMEEAVRREVMEEAGVVIGAVRYVASQPWPFPHAQLMLACIADAEDETIMLDTHELEDAFWASRSEVATALADDGGRFVPPPAYAIARTLLEHWAGNRS